MDTPNPDRVESVFHEALQRSDSEEREKYVAEACSGDEAMRRKVCRLLQGHIQAGTGFLRQSSLLQAAAEALEAELSSLASEEPGERMGSYKLIEKLGEGGFGVVWMAEQEQPVRRRVALKIIKIGMDTCLLYTSPSPRDRQKSRMPSSA